MPGTHFPWLTPALPLLLYENCAARRCFLNAPQTIEFEKNESMICSISHACNAQKHEIPVHSTLIECFESKFLPDTRIFCNTNESKAAGWLSREKHATLRVSGRGSGVPVAASPFLSALISVHSIWPPARFPLFPLRCNTRPPITLRWNRKQRVI